MFALGRSRLCLIVQTVWMLALVAALPLGARVAGIDGVAVGQAAVAVLVVIPSFVLTLRAVGIPAHAFLAPLVRPLLGSTALLLTAVGVRVAVGSPLLEIVVGVSCAAAVYVAVVWPQVKRIRFAGRASVIVDESL